MRTYCSPARSKSKGTCFTSDELKAMAISWNLAKLGNPIEFEENTSKQELWESLRERFQPCFEGEHNWLESKKVMTILENKFPDLYKAINFYALKPKSTEKKNGWLSNMNINYVMQQYHEYCPNFVFLGCYSSDHYTLNNSFPLKEILSNKYSAWVFNLDKTGQPGSHWVAVFVENQKDNIKVEYFDPVGDSPTKELELFLNTVKQKVRNAGRRITIEISTIVHQKGSSECGVYSLFYILQRIKGISKEAINNARISDKTMKNYRQTIFRPN